MKLLLTAAAVFFSILACTAQDSTQISPATKADMDAIYPGGSAAWTNFVNHTFRFPMDAVKKNIQGTVVVQFLVDASGAISDIHAISGPTQGGLREESVRLIGMSGNWLPGDQNGTKVKVYRKVPVEFKLMR